MAFADLALLLANAVYATSYVATRVVLDAVPPATLALLRLLVGALILVPLAWRTPWTGPVTRADHRRIAAMGVAGFAGAFAFTHCGLARSCGASRCWSRWGSWNGWAGAVRPGRAGPSSARSTSPW